MNPARARQELAKVERNRSDLEAMRTAAAGEVDRLLAAPDLDTQALRDQRAQLAHVVGRIRDLDDRAAALTRALPSAAVVQQAEADIVALHVTAAKTAGEFAAAAAVFVKAMTAAEVAARRLVAVRVAAVATVNAIAGVADEVGLVVTPAALPELAPADAAKTHLQALLASQVAAVLDVDDAVLRELNALRAGEGVAA